MLKKVVNLILVLLLLFCVFNVAKKAYNTYHNKITYEKIKLEKEQHKDDLINYLNEKDIDWITVTNTSIDYPIKTTDDNEYYLTHDINGSTNLGGAIFYDASSIPFKENNTIIYGHSMMDGSMFNNLHYFKNDINRFKKSEVIITRKNGEVLKYKPLGLYLTNDDWFFYNLNNISIKDAVKLIQKKSIYDIDVKYSDDSNIITLMTCSYEQNNERLFVFFISE